MSGFKGQEFRIGDEVPEEVYLPETTEQALSIVADYVRTHGLTPADVCRTFNAGIGALAQERESVDSKAGSQFGSGCSEVMTSQQQHEHALSVIADTIIRTGLSDAEARAIFEFGYAALLRARTLVMAGQEPDGADAGEWLAALSVATFGSSIHMRPGMTQIGPLDT